MTAPRDAGPLIGLYGGSFDPVHRGHLAIARRAQEQVRCDEIWFVPAARSPFKPEGAHAAADARVALLELALADEAHMSVCSVELEHPGRRSVETARTLRRDFPDHRWRWIMGEDSFAALPRWAEPEAFVALAAPIVQPRPGSTAPRAAEFAGAPVTWLEGEQLDVSSTAIRDVLARGERSSDLDSRVMDRIEALGLYRSEACR